MNYMKAISNVLAVIGILLFVYAIVGRFTGGASTVFGYVYALQAKTVVLGANTILILAVLAALCARDGKNKSE
jgi:hypothetical protein